jgi:hypothetical protein
MRQACEEFFAARLPFPGLAACSARLADGMVIHRCFDRWLTPTQVRQTIAHLAQSHENLRRHGLEPLRVTWSFEHLRVYISLRLDKACLALFLENRPELPLDVIETILSEFENLPGA